MNYRSKRFGKRCLLLLLVFLSIFGTAAAVYEGYLLKENRRLITELEQDYRRYEKNLYIAASDLSAGEFISEENVTMELRYTDENRDLYMTEADMGRILAVDVEKGTCLAQSMLLESEENLREVEITKIDVPGYLQEGDRVDVRISYGNAEDYVVLSGKNLVVCDKKTGIALRMKETEILLLSSALHDCERYQDTRLYLVKYPKGQKRTESEVNYIPNEEVLMLLQRTEETKKREQLEQRLTH